MTSRKAKTGKAFEKPITIFVKLKTCCTSLRSTEFGQEKWLSGVLAGDGERRLISNGKEKWTPKLVEKKDFPSFMVSPQAPVRGGARRSQCSNRLRSWPNIASTRTGLLEVFSMGGRHWPRLQLSGKFAAFSGSPICAAAIPRCAEKTQGLPALGI